MTPDSRPSAKIYPFPRRPLARAGTAGQPASPERAPQAPRVEFGEGWYHEAAIQAERPRKP